MKDGQILTERGFGYADVAKKKPVDPKLTLFRPGSVSKLFTWTAVMQLVEQGKLDLDADVNKYLADFQIPPRDGKPITLRNIMTHTAGFEEQVKNIITEDPEHGPTTSTLLKRWMPTRVFDAGTTPAYSNYATSLAGYIVERVSGESFYDYVDKHIFAPLGMKHSTLPPAAAEGARAADVDRLRHWLRRPAKKFEIVGPAPAGSLSSPGEDMAHFMIAHLQNGEYNGNRILKEETAEADARQPADRAAAAEPHGARLLRNQHQRPRSDRAPRRHASTSTPRCICSSRKDVGFYVSFNSAGQGRRGAAPAPCAVRRLRRSLLPRPPHTRRASTRRPPRSQHAQMIAATG